MQYTDGFSLSADLMAHSASPVHDQWGAFLLGVEGPATVEDALAVHEALACRVAVAA